MLVEDTNCLGDTNCLDDTKVHQVPVEDEGEGHFCSRVVPQQSRFTVVCSNVVLEQFYTSYVNVGL